MPTQPESQGLRIRGLSKRYRGGKLANAEIDLDIAPGEIFGFLGPNGAGKSTLVQQVIGLLKPTSGSIHLDGVDLVAHPDRARHLCSYLPQGSTPIDALSMREAIELAGRIRGGSKAEVLRRTDELLSELELDEWRDQRGYELSGGVRRLCGFVMASVWPSELLILDEPTNDVDPLRRRLLWRQIRRLGRNGTAVLLVTHNVLEAEQSVDRLAVIDAGRILASGTPAALKAPSSNRLRLEMHLPALADSGPDDADESDASATPDFSVHQTRLGNRLLHHLDPADGSRAIEWAEQEVRVGRAEGYGLSGASLEDVYLELIGRADAAAEEAS